MIGDGHRRALVVVARAVADLNAPWLVTGSTAAALQGVALSPHDIDVESTADGAYEIGERLAGYVVRPVEYGRTDVVRSHFGVFRVLGVTVEVMGGMQIRRDDGWGPPFAGLAGRTVLATPDGPVPVASLEALTRHYAAFGRTDRLRELRSAVRG